MNQLHYLKNFSTIVVDSGNIDLIRHYNPHHVTTNPSLIFKEISLNSHSKLIDNALDYAKKKGGDQQKKIINASDKLTVNIGSEILKNISGQISTEIDPKFSFSQEKIITKSHKLIDMYQENNIDKSRVLIKIAATWEGIKAAEKLEKNGIKCNLTLIFSFAQAKACAEANVYLISPFVGRIYDWYKKHNLLKNDNIENDPGIQSVKEIYHYYKKYSYNTIIMAASFRTIDQILALSGCDYLTISPNLLNILASNNQSIKRNLSYKRTCDTYNKPTPLSQSEFLWEHNTNKMAVEQLNAGIHKFYADQNNLYTILMNKMQN